MRASALDAIAVASCAAAAWIVMFTTAGLEAAIMPRQLGERPVAVDFIVDCVRDCVRNPGPDGMKAA